MNTMNTFARLIKVDEEKRIVIGRATQEIADKSDEILDYESSKPEFQKWSSDIEKASKGKSKGNVREMHGSKVAGTVQQMLFLDDEKAIDIHVKVVADDAWKMVKEGGYTGFSIGGSYVRKWKDPENAELTRFTPRVVEVSLVDNPCVPTATFEAIKADGTVEMRKFKLREEAQAAMEIKQVWLASDASTHETKLAAVAHEAVLKATGNLKPAADALAKLDEALKIDVEDKKKERKESEDEQDDQDDKEKKPELDPGAEKSEEDKKKEEDDEEKKAAAIAAIKKGLSEAWDCRAALDALCNIECLIMNERMEGDEEQMTDLEAVIARLKSFIASEIMEDSEKAAKVDELKKMIPADKHLLIDAIKAGARHSKGDMEHIANMSKCTKSMQDHHDAMHENLMEMHKCMKGLGMEGHDMGEEEDTNQKMAKLAAQNTALTEMLTKAVTAVEKLPELLKAKDSEITALKGRMEIVESTPLPRKSSSSYAIEKSHEAAGQPVEGQGYIIHRRDPA